MRGINRNIMECKVRYFFCHASLFSVLIETLWNVKLHRAVWLLIHRSVLIETLWNVKSGEGLGNSERAEWLFLGIYGN